jgi:hypothetical protein
MKKFEKALEELINCHSMENASNTPDFILAEYMKDCLNAFNKAANQREAWHDGKNDIS